MSKASKRAMRAAYHAKWRKRKAAKDHQTKYKPPYFEMHMCIRCNSNTCKNRRKVNAPRSRKNPARVGA